ncbi:MAG: winged helix-turn-helix domain-containing protein [Methanomassiliicoccales archaeon]|nr:winged helix-turn-helix domain-containing protein [Methanomassiliicoccales archaeon]
MMLEGMDFQIPRLTCDEDTGRILSFISLRPSCVAEISRTLSIPAARCYRRIREMEERDLVKRDGDKRDGADVYRSNLRSFRMMIEGEHLCQELEFEDGSRKTFELDVGLLMGEA